MIIKKDFISNFKKNDPYEFKEKKEKKRKTFGFNEKTSAYKYTDPTNKKDMYDKSIAMLNERLENNLITLDEFNKKCNQIGKRRAKDLKNNNKF